MQTVIEHLQPAFILMSYCLRVFRTIYRAKSHFGHKKLFV